MPPAAGRRAGRSGPDVAAAGLGEGCTKSGLTQAKQDLTQVPLIWGKVLVNREANQMKRSLPAVNSIGVFAGKNAPVLCRVVHTLSPSITGTTPPFH